MVKKKTKSHRQSLRTKYMINTKAKAHKKRLNKLARKGVLAPGRRAKKDPGIPQQWPYKEELLAEIQQTRESQKQMEAMDKDRRREAKRQQQKTKFNNKEMVRVGLVQERSRDDFTAWEKACRVLSSSADAVVWTLDARDPISCRCLDVEGRIRSTPGSRTSKSLPIIFALTKIDLVPASNLAAWIKFLGREAPVVVFKAPKHPGDETVGAKPLAQLLQHIGSTVLSPDHIGSLNVAILGCPGVGKTALVNAVNLVKSKTSSGRALRLLDTAGVKFGGPTSDPDFALRAFVKLPELKAPIECAKALLARCNQDALMEAFETSRFDSIDEFLELIAHKKHILKKGGVPHASDTARSIVADFVNRKVSSFCSPPTTDDTIADSCLIAEPCKFSGVASFLEANHSEAAQFLDQAEKKSFKLRIRMESRKPLPFDPAVEGLDLMDDDDEDDSAGDEEDYDFDQDFQQS